MTQRELPANASVLERVVRFFDGPVFPAFMIALLGFFSLALGAIIAIPAAPSGIGAFADAFRTWCFGIDAVTGAMEPIYVIMLVLDPILLIAILLAVWWRPLIEACRGARARLMRPVGLAALVALALAGGLFLLDDPARGDERAFPAVALRTAVPAPRFDLVDHIGERICSKDIEGKVTLVTAVYATCGLACPSIMAQARRAVAALDPEIAENLCVIGITLDPARDDVEVLSAMATAQGVAAPRWHLVTGPVAEVEAVLDAFGFARSFNPETGVIDHVNLFILIDKSGAIAYRFALGDLQEEWLIAGLKILLAEPVKAAISSE